MRSVSSHRLAESLRDFFSADSRGFIYVLSTLMGIFVFVFNSFSINGDDFFQLKIGEFIVKNHSFPTQDFLTWLGMQEKFRMTTFQWLYDVFLYLVHGLTGSFLLSNLFLGVCAALSFGLLEYYVYLRTKSHCAGLYYMLFAFLLGIFNYNIFFQSRPQTFAISLLLLALVLFEKKKYLWLFPVYIVALSWHSGLWPILMMPIALYLLDGKISREKLPLFFLPLTLLLMPDFIANLLLPFNMMFNNGSFNKIVGEYGSVFSGPFLSAGTISAMVVYALTVLLLFSYARDLIKEYRGRTRPRTMIILNALVIAAMAYLFFPAQRTLIMIVFLLAPFLMSSVAKWRASSLPTLRKYEIILLPSYALLVIFLITLTNPGNVLRTERQTIESSRNYPSEAIVSYIKTNGIMRIYNYNFGDGGYLGYRGILPMYDNRAQKMPQDNSRGFNYAQEYQDSIGSPTKILTLAKKYNVKYLLLYSTPGWKSALKDNGAIVVEDDRYMLLRLDNYDGAAR
jgi:hypothetical protein